MWGSGITSCFPLSCLQMLWQSQGHRELFFTPVPGLSAVVIFVTSDTLSYLHGNADISSSLSLIAIHLQKGIKRCLCGIIAYSRHVAPSGFIFEPGYSVLTPGKIHIKPSGGDGRLRNRGSAVLLPFKYHSAPLFGCMLEDYVLACQVLCHESAKRTEQH